MRCLCCWAAVAGHWRLLCAVYATQDHLRDMNTSSDLQQRQRTPPAGCAGV